MNDKKNNVNLQDKIYEKPNVEVISFDYNDVIATSGVICDSHVTPCLMD